MQFQRFGMWGGVAVAILLAAMPTVGHAAAAKAKGIATTSAQVTYADPALKQINLTIDPSPNILSGPPDPTYAVSQFELTVQFDPTELQLNGVVSSPNYQAQLDPEFSILGYGIAEIYGYAPSLGESSAVPAVSSGSGPSPADIPTGDVNIFELDFSLIGSATDDTPLTFTVGAFSQVDFIEGIDQNTGDTVEADGPDQVSPTTVTTSINQAAAALNANGVPLPNGAAAGMLGLMAAALFAVHQHKRSSRASSAA